MATASDVTIGKSTTASKTFDKSHPVGAETEYGKVEGFIHTTDDGIKSNVFLGVPFAQPPVGELRFEVRQREAVEVDKFLFSASPASK